MSSAMQPTILVIVGITGDLAKRKLLPAISELAVAAVLPEKFKIVGVTRRADVRIEDLFSSVAQASYHSEHLEIFQMQLHETADYIRLSAHLDDIGKSFNEPYQRLFYLSVPPQVSQPIIKLLGTSGVAAASNTKLLLEKPFGVDLASATDLVEDIDHYFKPGQVYRIDHYLAKEMAQNLIVFRDRNSLFKHTWNKDFIKSIEIVATEKIRIENRTAFYEQTGALRDLVQSHLLKLAALTLMDVPDSLEDVPTFRLKALQQLHVPKDIPTIDYAWRGQYTGYREEVDNPHSRVETYVNLTLHSSDPKWSGVPIKIITGKALHTKATEVRITYKHDKQYASNQLIIKLQPDEGIELRLYAQTPGYDRRVEHHSLKLAFKDHIAKVPGAYEQVFLDALHSQNSQFTTNQEVLESWRILALVQKQWAMSSEDLVVYKPGTKPENIHHVKA